MLRAAFQGNKQGIFRKMNAIIKNQDLKISYLPSLEKIGCELGDTLFMQANELKHKPKLHWNGSRTRKSQLWTGGHSRLTKPTHWKFVKYIKGKLGIWNSVPQNGVELWVVVNESWSNKSSQILNNFIWKYASDNESYY